ncbi:MAG: GAF domain-containing protein [Phycisphaerae bacterium]|nr:GAF domain-containing protein [Phycisphaerae bacterium]
MLWAEIVGKCRAVSGEIENPATKGETMMIEDEHYQKVEALLEASRAVLAYTSFAESARAIFNQAKRITGAKAGYVALMNEVGDENEVLFLDAGGLPCTVDPNLPMPIRGLRASCYASGKAVFDNEFMSGQWTKYLPSGHVAMKNVLFAPLIIEGKVVGIIGLANKARDFTAEDARMASAFGEFAAVALQNSRNLDKLRTTVERLEHALQMVKTLRGIIPICAKCKKIRNDEGYWQRVEEYIHEHADVDFSHGLCPDCLKEYEKELE